MIVRFARHGQPALEGIPPGANHELPPLDYPLSELGRRQAHFLGEHLKRQSFHGRIIASPYARTAETASVVAHVLGQKFYVEPRLQEMRFYPDPPCPGMTIEELHRNYAEVAPDATLAWPWLTPGGAEVIDVVRRRVDQFVAELVAQPPAEDVLLIGHGASIQALKWNFFQRATYSGPDHYNWNCSLSSFKIAPSGRTSLLELARIDFIPTQFITSNLRRWGDPECR